MITVYKKPNLQSVSEVGNNSTIRLQYNGVGYVTSAEVGSMNVKWVSSLSDLPSPLGGVITLPPNADFYIFLEIVDLAGNELVVNNNSLMGSSQETGGVANGTVTINDTAPIKYFRFDNCPVTIDALSGNFDWQFVNFYDTANAITITNASNVVFLTFGFINSYGLTVNGAIDSLVLTNSIFRSITTDSINFLDITSTAVINRRIRVEDSVFATGLAGQNSIVVDPLAVINDESFLAEDLRFTGPGTALIGINGDVDKGLFKNCIGGNAINTAVKAYVYMKNNVTPTTVLAIGTRYEVAGTVTLDTTYAQRLALSSNRAVYTSDVPRQVTIQAQYTLSSASNNVIGTYIAINRNGNPIDPTADRISESEMYTTSSGSRPDSGTCQCVTTLSKDDKVYIVTQNTTAINDVTYSFLNYIIRES